MRDGSRNNRREGEVKGRRGGGWEGCQMQGGQRRVGMEGGEKSRRSRCCFSMHVCISRGTDLPPWHGSPSVVVQPLLAQLARARSKCKACRGMVTKHWCTSKWYGNKARMHAQHAYVHSMSAACCLLQLAARPVLLPPEDGCLGIKVGRPLAVATHHAACSLSSTSLAPVCTSHACVRMSSVGPCHEIAIAKHEMLCNLCT